MMDILFAQPARPVPNKQFIYGEQWNAYMTTKPKDTRILCVCKMGETRSCATRRRLNRRGYGIAVGARAPELQEFVKEQLNKLGFK